MSHIQTSDEVVEILRDLLLWTKVSSFKSVRAALESALPDDKARAIYLMSDGKRTGEEIRKRFKVSPNTLLEMQKRWVAIGIMDVNANGKRVANFDLADFNLLPVAAEFQDLGVGE